MRLLPWLLDPAVPWTVAAPFARGLVAVALEAAVLVGWPVGWALGAFRCVESGEARVLLTLGESAETTVLRLAPQGAFFAALLAAGSLVYGSDAGAPGRVATELVAQARVSCAGAHAPKTYSIPFTDMTWLCAPGSEPRLAGSGPGAMSGAMITRRGGPASRGTFACFSRPRARAPAFEPAPGDPRGLGHPPRHGALGASTLSAALRAVLLVIPRSSGAAALAACAVLLRAVRGRLSAGVVGAIGPLAALGVLRALERQTMSFAGGRVLFFALVPLPPRSRAPRLPRRCSSRGSHERPALRLRHKGLTARSSMEK